MGKGGQIWLKCIAGDLIMVKRDKNNIFERVENFHADLAWNYPFFFLPKEWWGISFFLFAKGMAGDFPLINCYSFTFAEKNRVSVS